MKILLALKLSSDSLMVAELAAIKKARGVTSAVLVTDTKYKTELEGVRYYYLPRSQAKLPFFRVFFRIPLIYRICRRENIDLIIAYHLTSFGFAGTIVSLLCRIPVSLHFLGEDIDIWCRKPIFGRLLLKFASLSTGVTVQGTQSQNFLLRRGLGNVHIIPTAFDPQKIPHAPTSEQIDEKPFDIIFIGRLSKEKRVDRFVEIVKKIQGIYSDISAAILGDGPEKALLLQGIHKHRLEKNIQYLGWVDNVYIYLQQAKIFVLTSDNDQLPSALLESMAVGIVPVVSNVGNVADAVTPGTGEIVRKEDVDQFAQKIISLLEDKKKYEDFSKRAIEKSLEFTIDANAKRWAGVFSYLFQSTHISR